MHEEPLHLIPHEHRDEVTRLLKSEACRRSTRLLIEADLCPFCRQMFNERMERYGATGHGRRGRPGSPLDPLRAGSRGDRHVPAER